MCQVSDGGLVLLARTRQLGRKRAMVSRNRGKSVCLIMRSDLVVLEHLRPFLLVRRGDEVALHVERHRVKMDGPYELKPFQLAKGKTAANM